METFKDKCKALGVNYARALKRREAGLSEDKIFKEGYVRESRITNAITVFGATYSNLKEAMRVLHPPASSKTIARWIKAGKTPEEAFERIPNPGYANGIIYLATHKGSGKQYIGLTIQTLERRWQYHIEQAMAGYVKSEKSFHEAIRKYGAVAFELQQIDYGMTKKGLEKKEREWIKQLNTVVPDGYNISPGGVSGGSDRKPTSVDGLFFTSTKEATAYVSETRGVSLHAAKWRLRHDKLDIKAPAKPGESLVKTRAYKAWSRIVHGAMNPKSKDYIPGLVLHDPWRNFAVFMQGVGQPPGRGMAFVRLDQSQGFSPANCAWVSKSEASKINASYMKENGLLVGRRGNRSPRPVM